jgi:hypothetical protein
MYQPLFILAPPRSFTSITCGMIGQHPQMYGLPEVNLFAADDYAGLQHLYGRFRSRLGHGLLRAMAELGLGAQTVDNVEAVREWLAQEPSTTTAELFADLARWAEPRHLVDKSPIYVYSEENLNRILNAFPDSRFLHLARHPRSHCESVGKIKTEMGDREAAASGRGGQANRGPRRFIREGQMNPDNIWLNPHKRIMAFLEQVPAEQQRFIRGEELLADPDRLLVEIARWLGIRDDDEALEAMKHPENSPYACYGPNNARVGNDPGFIEDAALRRYEPKALSLDGPLSWDAGVELSEEIRLLAEKFGY